VEPQAPRKTGRPKHFKSETLISKVKMYAEIGTPHHDIALLVDMSIKTLLKYYRKELDVAAAQGKAIAGGMLRKAIVNGEPWAIKFFLACQAGWRETSVVQNQALDRNGLPVDPPKLGISFIDGGPGHGNSVVDVSAPSAEIQHDEPLEDTESVH
jgi:hypothetical protein